MLTLLQQFPGKQFFGGLRFNSQEELDAFRKDPNHPAIVVAGHHFLGDPNQPAGVTKHDYLVVPDDEPLEFSRDTGNNVVYNYQRSKRHKVRKILASMCMNKEQHDAMIAKYNADRRAETNARLAADPLRGCISVATLKKLLDEAVPLADQNHVMVALSADSEGNSYSPIGSIDASYKNPDGYVAAPSQMFKGENGRTNVIYVEFVPRSKNDILDGSKAPKNPQLSRRNAIVLFPVN